MLGCNFETCLKCRSTPKDFKPALKNAIEEDKPAIIEVEIEKDSETNPWKYIHG